MSGASVSGVSALAPSVGSSVSALRRSQELLGRVSARLASGSRIERAADDPAGLAMSETMDSKLRSARQAQRNVSTAINIFQTLESTFDTFSSIYKRQKELAIQALSDTVDADARALANAEYTALAEETARVFTSGLVAVLDRYGVSDSSVFNIIVGPESELGTSMVSFDAADWGFVVPAMDNILTPGDAGFEMASLDFALEATQRARAVLGAWQNRLAGMERQLDAYLQNGDAARSRIVDSDFAAETAILARQQILQQSGISVLAQAGKLSSSWLRLLS
jgi:flagellin